MGSIDHRTVSRIRPYIRSGVGFAVGTDIRANLKKRGKPVARRSARSARSHPVGGISTGKPSASPGSERRQSARLVSNRRTGHCRSPCILSHRFHCCHRLCRSLRPRCGQLITSRLFQRVPQPNRGRYVKHGLGIIAARAEPELLVKPFHNMRATRAMKWSVSTAPAAPPVGWGTPRKWPCNTTTRCGKRTFARQRKPKASILARCKIRCTQAPSGAI